MRKLGVLKIKPQASPVGCRPLNSNQTVRYQHSWLLFSLVGDWTLFIVLRSCWLARRQQAFLFLSSFFNQYPNDVPELSYWCDNWRTERGKETELGHSIRHWEWELGPAELGNSGGWEGTAKGPSCEGQSSLIWAEFLQAWLERRGSSHLLEMLPHKCKPPQISSWLL